MGRLSDLFGNPEATKRGRLAELLYQQSIAQPAPVPDVRTNAPQVMGGLLGMIDSAKRRVGKNLSELVNNPDQYLRLIAERLPETAQKMASDPGNFIGGGMLGTVGKVGKTQYELAHEVAQRNAALQMEQGGLGKAIGSRLADVLREQSGIMGSDAITKPMGVATLPTKQPIDEMLDLYHGSPESSLEIQDKGTFGGVFASANAGAAASHGENLHQISVPKRFVAESADLDTQITEEYLKKRLGLNDDDYDMVYDLIVRGKSLYHTDAPEDKILDIFRSTDLADAGWFAQKLRGEIAKENGFKAVEMPDEHGTSYLVLPGNKAVPLKK